MSQGRGLRSLPVTLIVIGIAFAVAVPSFLISSAQAIRNSAPTSLEGARSASPLLQTNRSLVVAWWDLSSNDIFFDWSGDGGITWNTDKRVNDVPGSATGAGTWQLAIPAMAVDPERGAMYIAWPDSRNGNLDIYAAASTDGGVTWSQNNRVNDDSGSSVQYMVDLAVDSRGTVHAAWEDKRNGSWNIYYSNSTDGGQTWAANVLISSENTPGIYNRPGDYFAIEAGPDDSISIVWTDGRGSDFDIYYAKSPSFFNVRITDGSSPFAWQVEPTMAINRTGAVFVGWKETNGSEAAGLRVGFSYSTDQGATWAANILMNQSHPGGGCSNSDPWMGMGPDGRVQYAYLEFNCANGQNGLDVANTSDGETWSTIHYAPGAGGLTDKESIVVAPSGRIYAAWDEGNVMDVTWSDNGGTTWASFQDPDDHPGGVLGAVIRIGVPVETITVATVPTGLPIAVDGATATSPATYAWLNGSSHTVSVSSLISGATGTRFVWASWSDGGAISHSIVADSDRTITAVWHTQYSLTIQAGPGTATTADWYDAGAPAVASLASGIVPGATGTRSVFVSWNGDASGTDSAGSQPIPMNGPRTVGTTWRTEYELRITTAYGSAVGAGWYQAGSSATASVNASVIGTAAGERVVFAGWTGDAAGDVAYSSSPILMSGPRTANAQWSKEYFLQVDSDIGTVDGSGWYREGTSVQLHASTEATSAGQTYRFSGWSGGVTSADASVTVTMTGPMIVRANWTTATAVGGLSGTALGLMLLILGIALVIGLLVASRRRRKE